MKEQNDSTVYQIKIQVSYRQCFVCLSHSQLKDTTGTHQPSHFNTTGTHHHTFNTTGTQHDTFNKYPLSTQNRQGHPVSHFYKCESEGSQSSYMYLEMLQCLTHSSPHKFNSILQSEGKV